jgi:hypothetical protein
MLTHTSLLLTIRHGVSFATAGGWNAGSTAWRHREPTFLTSALECDSNANYNAFTDILVPHSAVLIYIPVQPCSEFLIGGRRGALALRARGARGQRDRDARSHRRRRRAGAVRRQQLALNRAQ